LNIEEYKKKAIRTESKIEEINVDPDLLSGILNIIVSSGEILDQIKKNVFYNKEYNNEVLIQKFTNIVESLNVMKPSLVNGISPTTTISVNPRIFHALLGITTEATELIEILLNNLSKGMEFDKVHLLEESFDVDWYQFILLDELNGKVEDVWDVGLKKLEKRYPEKFSSDNAIKRDLEAERKILDNLE
jgi:hypothetical protein